MTVGAENGEAVVHLVGELDLCSRDRIVEALTDASVTRHRLVIDLSRTTFIDSRRAQAVCARRSASVSDGFMKPGVLRGRSLSCRRSGRGPRLCGRSVRSLGACTGAAGRWCSRWSHAAKDCGVTEVDGDAGVDGERRVPDISLPWSQAMLRNSSPGSAAIAVCMASSTARASLLWAGAAPAHTGLRPTRVPTADCRGRDIPVWRERVAPARLGSCEVHGRVDQARGPAAHRHPAAPAGAPAG